MLKTIIFIEFIFLGKKMSFSQSMHLIISNLEDQNTKPILSFLSSIQKILCHKQTDLYVTDLDLNLAVSN